MYTRHKHAASQELKTTTHTHTTVKLNQPSRLDQTVQSQHFWRLFSYTLSWRHTHRNTNQHPIRSAPWHHAFQTSHRTSPNPKWFNLFKFQRPTLALNQIPHLEKTKISFLLWVCSPRHTHPKTHTSHATPTKNSEGNTQSRSFQLSPHRTPRYSVS